MNVVELLNAIIEATNEAIIIIDSNNRSIKCNRQLLKLICLPPEKVINLPIAEVLPGLDTNKPISNYQFDSHANSFVVRVEEKKLEDDHCKIIFLSENHFNIEIANQYSEMKTLIDIYESILNSIDEGIQVADINGYVRYINPSQKKLDGFTDDVIGKHWTDVYDLDEETSLVLRALRRGKSTYDQSQNYVTRGGKFVSIVCSSMPLYSGGKLIGAFSISKDFFKFKDMAVRILHIDKQNNKILGKKEGKVKDSYYSFSEILGKNKMFQESIANGKAASKSSSSVLIYGETGSGKEMIAQSIHTESSRCNGPFLAINCAAIPENLLESILFGTTKGAFTGAVDRAGLFELANDGTLFLDEINSMAIQLQSKLLRVVEEKKIMRIGGKENISTNLRLLSSCNEEPFEAIEKGHLRSDLFYRLAVIYIYLPPLRERIDDLDLLISFFIDKYNREMKKQVAGISDEVKEMFHLYSWPGNVRELTHCIECAVNLAQENEKLIRPGHLPKYLVIRMQNENAKRSSFSVEPNVSNNKATTLDSDRALQGSIIEQIQQQEKEEIIIALKKSKGNIAQAAKILGLSRQRLHYRVKKYGLK